MGEYFVLMNFLRELPLKHNKTVEFDAIGSIGYLLVFDSLESLREISPHGEYVKIENIKSEHLNSIKA
jgi:hypothetical protein